MHTHMQRSLDTMTTWASTWKVTFSALKTQMVIFWHRTTLPPTYRMPLCTAVRPLPLHLSGFEIERVDSYVYLGVTLFKTLSWEPHINDIIRKASPTSHQISRLVSCTSRPSLPVIRHLVAAVLIPKLAYGLPFITLPYKKTPLYTSLKRLIITPLRRALGVPHNAHHNSVMLESRLMPLNYFQCYLSITTAKRHIMQANDAAEQQRRYSLIFTPQSYTLPIMHPLRNIASNCRFAYIGSNPPSLQQLQTTTNKTLRQHVFNRFYHDWKLDQSTALIGNTHSLLPFYKDIPTLEPTKLPSYLKVLNTTDATTMARLRFNRARLNQSLHHRSRSDTDMCPTCGNANESVEHILMHCPRYAKARYDCQVALSYHTPYVLSLQSILGSHQKLVSTTSMLTSHILNILATFIRNIRTIRRM